MTILTSTLSPYVDIPDGCIPPAAKLCLRKGVQQLQADPDQQDRQVQRVLEGLRWIQIKWI